jgi:Zn finger protein HypA/HybF involved in hydrogenase expression
MSKKQKYVPEKKNDYATSRFKQTFKACFRKVKFNERQAKQHAEKYDQRVYLCPHCGSNHLASKG